MQLSNHATIKARVTLRRLRDRRQQIVNWTREFWTNFNDQTDIVGDSYLDNQSELADVGRWIKFYKQEMAILQYASVVRERVQRNEDGSLTFYNVMDEVSETEEE